MADNIPTKNHIRIDGELAYIVASNTGEEFKIDRKCICKIADYKWAAVKISRYKYARAYHSKVNDKQVNIYLNEAVSGLNPDNRNYIIYVNNDTTDCTIANLRLVPSYAGTHRNVGACYGCKGSNHHNAKLNEQKVKEIRLLCKSNRFTNESIAKSYGITINTLCGIKYNQAWKEVK